MPPTSTAATSRAVRRPSAMNDRTRSRASASTSGPIRVPGSAAGPTRRLFTASASRPTKASCTRSSTITREQAEHFCPWKPNPLCTTATTASSRSASSSTMIAFLPPISAITRFTSRLPGDAVAAVACALIASPTAREPVKATSAVSGCETSVGPTSSPRPGRKASAAGGTPASSSISCSRSAISDDCSAGFITTVLPVTSAAVVMPARIASGKFHGAITTATPRGSHAVVFSSPGTSTLAGLASRSASWA